MRHNNLYIKICSGILFLIVPLSYGQSFADTTVVGRTVASENHSVKNIHIETEHENFCRVTMIPIKAPTPSIRLLQSNERFRIIPFFDTSITPIQQDVILHAINEWESITLTSGLTPANYVIGFMNGPLFGPLASTLTTFYEDTGNLESAVIIFDNTANWFVDQTPADDIEFQGTSPAPSGVDLLSVARHEIAHAIGWVKDSARVDNLMSGNTFDSQRLNIAIDSDGMHTDPLVYKDNLMLSSIGASIRRPISLYPDSALLARAFHYDITMQFVDVKYSGFLMTGSANAPWNTLRDAFQSIPADYNLLVIPERYHEITPLIANTPMVISAARGGDVNIGGQ